MTVNILIPVFNRIKETKKLFQILGLKKHQRKLEF